MNCETCDHAMSRWTDVTYATDMKFFCSLKCVYEYRGKEKLA